MNHPIHENLFNHLSELEPEWIMLDVKTGTKTVFGIGYKGVKYKDGSIKFFNTKGHEHYPQMGLSELSKIWDDILKRK